MKVSVDVYDDVAREVQCLPENFKAFSSPALDAAVRQYHAVQDFMKKRISLTDLASVFKLDHIDTIVWLKENGYNPPSIQGYSENGFPQETEDEIDSVMEEVENGIGLSRGFDNVEEFLKDLHKEAAKHSNGENDT